MHKIYFDFFLKYFILLLPLTYIVGPAAININLFIIIINFIIILLLNFNNQIFFNFIKKKEFLVFFIFYFYLNLLSFFSDDVSHSLKSSIPFIKFFFLIVVFSYLLNKKLLTLNLIAIVFVSIFIFVLSDSLMQIFVGYNFFNFEPIYGQITGIFRKEQILGSYISRMLPVILGFFYIINISNKYRNYSIFLILFLSLIVILYSGERTALLNFLFLSTLLFLFKIIKINFISIILLLSTLTLIITLLFNNDYLKDRFIKTNLDEFKKTYFFKIPFPDHYLLHYSTAIKIFLERPIVGMGPNTFRKNCNKERFFVKGTDYFPLPQTFSGNSSNLTKQQNKQNAQYHRLNTLHGCSTHPHNMHLQTLAEIGIVGYSFFIYLFFFIFKNFFNTFNNFNNNSYRKCMLIGIIINFIPIMPSGNIFGSYFNFIIFLPILFFFLQKPLKTKPTIIKNTFNNIK